MPMRWSSLLKTGKPLEDIKTAWGAVLKAAKVSGFRFHELPP
jgi:hypothetical protein